MRRVMMAWCCALAIIAVVSGGTMSVATAQTAQAPSAPSRPADTQQRIRQMRPPIADTQSQLRDERRNWTQTDWDRYVRTMNRQ